MIVPNPHKVVPHSKVCEYCGHSWRMHSFQGEVAFSLEGTVLCSIESCRCPLSWCIDPEHEKEFEAYIENLKAQRSLQTIPDGDRQVIYHTLIEQNSPLINLFSQVVAPLRYPPQNTLSYKLGGTIYHFELPAWWHEVEINLPDKFNSDEDIRRFITEQYGADTGTSSTWKQALKCWALASLKLSRLPIYIGHCFHAGGKHQKAIKTYSELFELTPLLSENKDWYAVFLPFLIGKEYLSLGQPSLAIQWFSKAAIFQDSPESANRHYAMESQKTIDYLINRIQLI